MKTLIFIFLPFFGFTQTIKIIGINNLNKKITRFENSTIELDKCNIYDYYKVKENIDSIGLDICTKADHENVIYYLVNLDKKVGMMMIMREQDICRATSWYDGIELNTLIKSKL